MCKFRSITIFYFSGTGNAKKIADWTSEFARRRNIECQIVNIAKIDFNSIEAVNPETLIVIISPIHGFNYPKLVLRFIKHLPGGENYVVLMNTRAGMKIGRIVTPGLTGIAFMLSSLLLKMKGYKIKGQIPFDMPSNWISVHPALKVESIKFIFNKNYERIEKHCNIIFSGEKDFHSFKDLIQDVLLAPVSFLYYIAGRFIFAKSYFASSACNNCGLCIKNCPVKSIKLVAERPFWTLRCESCMKCMNSCPQNAIETAHGLFVLISIIGSVITNLALSQIPEVYVQHWYIRLTLFTMVFFTLLGFLYRIQQYLLKIKLISMFIEWTSLTHYKFWGRYKISSDDKLNPNW